MRSCYGSINDLNEGLKQTVENKTDKQISNEEKQLVMSTQRLDVIDTDKNGWRLVHFNIIYHLFQMNIKLCT